MTVERIDPVLCNGCGICVDSCSVDVLRLNTQAAAGEEWAPCRTACPAGVDMRRYIHLMREGMVEEALKVITEALPFPAITGRICPHPCEKECARKDIDAAVNINALERFAADNCPVNKTQPARRIFSARVAVIGSGPAGLAASFELCRNGYPVTVFESLPVLGGMLRTAVPDYRLPKNILDSQINIVRDMGVEFITGTTFGRDLSLADLKQRGFQAVFLACGAQLSRRLDIGGCELEGVTWGLDFLQSYSLKGKSPVKDRVLVIGGGNVAVDVALTALRLGARIVQIACLESKEDMPAYPEEIRQAEEEGVIINPSWGPKRILGDGKQVKGLELVRCASVTAQNGSFSPSYRDDITTIIETDMIIFAVGQVSDLSLIPREIKATGAGTILIDPVTLETTLPGVFAGGDIISTRGAAIQAIADGQRAAASIDRYLKGQDLKAGRPAKRRRVSHPPAERIEKQPRQETPLAPVGIRQRNFKEVKTAFNEDAMIIEARRCTTCGSKAVIRYPDECMACDSCELNCPQNAIYVSPARYAPLMVGWR
jgi:NADPH-dependent glutamate synthase beta subunit-like oxidoreductase/NAD-dependent dihydropyrimidine dehydrogenase PreA subunit